MEAVYGRGKWSLKSKAHTTLRKDLEMGNIFSLFGKSPDRITVNDLMKMIENGEKVTLLDVRMPGEHIQGHIPGSIFDLCEQSQIYGRAFVRR